MIYSPIIVVGSGPSGSTVAYSLIEEKAKVLLLDQGYTKDTKIKDKKNNVNFFHPKLKNKDFDFVLYNFLKKNKIISNNFVPTGSLALGGLSNIWGGGYWNYFNQSFDKNFENFLKNNFRILNFDQDNSNNLSNFLNKKNNINFYKDAQLLAEKNKREIFNSTEMIKKLIHHSNFKYMSNIFIDSIKCEEEYFILTGENEEKFKCKKLILACGTIGSTRLIMKLNKLINIKQNLLHNITYGFIAKLKEKKTYSLLKKHSPSSIFIYNLLDNKKSISGSIGRFSLELGEFINQNYFFPLNFLINKTFEFYQSKLIFGKIFLPVDFSKTKISLQNDGKIIIEGSKNKEIEQNEKRLLNEYFMKNIKAFNKIYLKELPLGSDAHYTSTMSSDSEIDALRTSKNGELISRNNLFIVDGSILNKDGSHFPTFEIMSNAYKIGKYIANNDN